MKSFPQGDVLVYESPTDIVLKIREVLTEYITEVGGCVTIGLSGGSMPALMAQVLLPLPLACIAKLKLFCVDERLVDTSDSDSNTGAYLKALSADFKSKFVPVTNVNNVEQAADDYEKALRALKPDLTADGLPRFDFLFLGMGPDGHTCSLFPGHELLSYKGPRWIVPIEDSPKPPPRRITITLPVCNAAKKVVFIATGENKRGVISKIFTENDDSFPAGRIRGQTPTLWFLDPSAAKNIVTEYDVV